MLPLRDRLPSRTVPFVTYALIALNILAFVWTHTAIAAGYPPEQFVWDWGLVPKRFLANPGGESVTVLTSMFMHDPTNWMHIGGNMLFLWIFGDNVEDALGHARYAAFYLLAGAAAATAQVTIDPASPIPMVGASGAISGVLAAYGTLYPKSPILVLNPFLPLWLFFGVFWELPAWFIILEYFVVNLLNGIVSLGSRSGGVAFFAHLGGFVAGLFLVRLFSAGREHREHDRWRGLRPGHPGRRQVGAPGRRGPWDW